MIIVFLAVLLALVTLLLLLLAPWLCALAPRRGRGGVVCILHEASQLLQAHTVLHQHTAISHSSYCGHETVCEWQL
jgi:hypothetical protein